MPKVQCHSCGQVASFVDRLGLREECGSCSEDLHVCKNCRFYDPGSYNECREPSAEVVREKERANFCDYFEASVGGHNQKDSKPLLDAAEALFKKK